MTWLRLLTQKITSALLIEWAEARNELFLGLTIYIAGELNNPFSQFFLPVVPKLRIQIVMPDFQLTFPRFDGHA